MEDTKSLSHTKWNCKYHIVFAPKFRRKVFYKEKREEIGKILRELCKWKQIEIIEAEMSGPCAYAGGDTPKDECVGCCRFFERKEHLANI